MNVLLVVTNIDGFSEITYSFGLSSISSYIQKKGYKSKTILIKERSEYKLLADEIVSFKPQVVGFSTVSSQFACVKEAAQIIKDLNRDIIIVCGGIHPTIYPNALIQAEYVDAFFVGESEMAFGDFLEKIREGKDFYDVMNLAYKKGGKVVRNPLNPLIDNLDILPFPTKDAIFEEYIRKHGKAPFLFSRGCPFSCTYCSNKSIAKVYGKKVNNPRYRSVNSCIDEIKQALSMYEFSEVRFLDDILGINKEWRSEFCEAYKKEIGLRFVCLLRPNVVNEEFIRLLKYAGCYRIQLGIESGNAYIRNTVLKRNISEKEIINAFALCNKYKIETNAINMIGIPGETEDMIWDTINLNRKINPTDSCGDIFYPYQGTPLGDYCFSEMLVDQAMYNDFTNERRDSVLRYPKPYKERLQYYNKKWQVLVDPYDLRKRVIYYDLKKRVICILKNHKSAYELARRINLTFKNLKNAFLSLSFR